MSSPTIKNIFVQTEHLVFTGSFVAGSEYRKQDSGKHPMKGRLLFAKAKAQST